MHCHSLFFSPDGVTVFISNGFFVFLYILWVLSRLHQLISALSHLFCMTFSSTLYMCFCTFFCACISKLFPQWLKKNFSSLGVSYRQSGWLIFSVSLHNIMNMKITAIKRSEFSHFSARLWHRLCLVVLAVKGSNRLGYSINERPLVSVPNC